MKRTIFFAFALTFALTTRSQALPLVDIDVSYGIGMRGATGDITYQGTSADLKNSLGLSDTQQGMGRLKIKHAIPVLPNLYLNYLPMKFTGTGTVTQAFTFGNQSYTAGVPVTSELDLSATEVGIFYDIPLVKTATGGILEPEIGLNAKIISFVGRVTGSGVTKEKTASIPVPMLYAGVGIHPIDLLSVNAEIKTLSAAGNGITDWDVELKVKPIPVLYISVGYFSESVTIDSNEVKANIKISGPFFALGAAF